MQKIRDRSKVPRELYDYTVPETQVSFKAHSFGLLVRKVADHYAANQITPPEKLSSVVETHWCSRYPYHCEDPDAFVPKDKPSSDMLAQVIAAAAIPAADALAAISKAFGINCSGCKKRHSIIREMKKRGVAETVRLLKETLHA